jgi:preprotein translocase subunit Sss1
LPNVDIEEVSMLRTALKSRKPKKKNLRPLRARKPDRREFKTIEKPILDLEILFEKVSYVL